ncbi:hypothetical protein Ate01nite_25170 [Actinoplanes teichomyceticus]|nr:hypothetical protein Ate01nite_25170 [Actinoplanes teichomyceticus]
MAVGAEVLGKIVARHEALGPHLNERQRRLSLAVEARLLGHGGVRAVARAAGVSETTVRAVSSSWKPAKTPCRQAGSVGRAAVASR